MSYKPEHLYGQEWDYEEENLKLIEYKEKYSETYNLLENRLSPNEEGELREIINLLELPSRTKYVIEPNIGSSSSRAVVRFFVDAGEDYLKFRQTVAKLAIMMNTPLLLRKGISGSFFEGNSRSLGVIVTVFEMKG